MEYTIKDVCNMFNVSASTVRYWDLSGKLKAKRDKMNYRYYTQKDIDSYIKENNIVLSNSSGDFNSNKEKESVVVNKDNTYCYCLYRNDNKKEGKISKESLIKYCSDNNIEYKSNKIKFVDYSSDIDNYNSFLSSLIGGNIKKLIINSISNDVILYIIKEICLKFNIILEIVGNSDNKEHRERIIESNSEEDNFKKMLNFTLEYGNDSNNEEDDEIEFIPRDN